MQPIQPVGVRRCVTVPPIITHIARFFLRLITVSASSQSPCANHRVLPNALVCFHVVFTACVVSSVDSTTQALHAAKATSRRRTSCDAQHMSCLYYAVTGRIRLGGFVEHFKIVEHISYSTGRFREAQEKSAEIMVISFVK